jgi:hypothetical protein
VASQERYNYQSYLLRLWRESPHKPWRILLQCIATGERFGFASPLELHEFLLQQTTDPTDAPDFDQVQGAPK